MTDRLFGTDGIRGKANEGWFTPDFCLRLGQAVAEVARGHGIRPIVLLGNDGRRSAGLIGNALSAGLLREGFNVNDVGLITTPGLATLTRLHKAGLGAMISASHNPAQDNGIKLFGPRGAKLEDSLENSIESVLRANIPISSRKTGRARIATEWTEDYLLYLKKQFPPKFRLKGFRIVLDSANGGASDLGPKLLESLGARVIALANNPNGDNINKKCGALYPRKVSRAVKRFKAHLGISLDGDGDRCILSDEKGKEVDGDGILNVLARELLQRGKLRRKTVVATVMSNLGLRRALGEAKIKIETVPVGDKNVVQAMKGRSLNLGGEQSGHIILGKENFFIGDGLYTALKVLEAMRRSGKPLSELNQSFKKFPQVLKNVRVATKPPLDSHPRIVQAVRQAEAALKDSGRILLRYSGTEPLARIMIEGPEIRTISALADSIARVVQDELS